MKGSLVTLMVACVTPALMASADAIAAELPQLDLRKAVVCSETLEGVAVRLQCDETTRRCLVATPLLRDADGAVGTVAPRELTPCSQQLPRALQDRKSAGYVMVPARLDAPFGYKRDARGRLLQTHFDLRRRYWVGVHWMATLPPREPRAWQRSAVFEVGGAVEEYDEYESRRSRFRFLEGTLRLSDLEIEGLLFQYDYGRRSERSPFWLTTLVGEPRRYDINIDLGPGVSAGRFWFGPVEELEMGLVDIAEGHVNWEMFQTANLEDYLLVRMGAGVGVRFFSNEDTAAVYLFPEIGVEWAWLMGRRGLAQLKVDGRVRLAYEPNANTRWVEGKGAVGFERILIAITDQPVAVFAEPAIHVLELPGGRSKFDLRFTIGGRLSLFVPPREADDLCPNEPEDFDGFRDDDGCLDLDNDGDGVPDLEDHCPLEAEDADGVEDGDGCPDY